METIYIDKIYFIAIQNPFKSFDKNLTVYIASNTYMFASLRKLKTYLSIIGLCIEDIYVQHTCTFNLYLNGQDLWKLKKKTYQYRNTWN